MISSLPELQSLNWISPSRYTALERCPYNVVLSSSFKKPLLPYKPNNHLGKVIHKCIELIFTGEIKTEQRFEQLWNKFIQREEDKLIEMGFDFLTPLEENISGFRIKKLQIKKLINRKDSDKKDSQGKTFLEKWLKSKDGLIKGKVDLIYKNDGYSKIIDFKSGRVLNENGEVKDDYKEQLKLYAFLYEEEFESYPNTLSVIDVNNKEYQVNFSIEEIEDISNRAKKLLKKINSLVTEGSRKELAKPTKENCKWCLYKPACKFHWQVGTDQIFKDINGELVSVRRFNNGNINVSLRNNSGEIVIEGYDEKMLGYFSNKKGSELAFFNLVSLEKTNRYKKIKTTKIYSSFA